MNGCGTWAQHLIDTHCLQSHRQRICPSHSTWHGSYVLISNHYHQGHNGPTELSPVTMRRKILYICIIVTPWAVSSCCSITHFFADNMDFSPYWLFTSGEHDVRVYTEWMSSNGAWELQVSSKHRILTSSVNRLFTTGKYSCRWHIMQYHLVVR